MPPIDILAKSVVEEICKALPEGAVTLKTVPEGESIEPGYDVKGYDAEIIPSSAKSPRILVHAPKDSWEANVGFGNHSNIEVWYKQGSNADSIFMQDLRNIITTIMISRWEERVVMLGNSWVCSIAVLPDPIGQIRSPLGLKGLLAPILPTGLKVENVVIWEPYPEPSKLPR